MEKYESPTIEQAGGPGSGSPESVIALFAVAFIVAAVVDFVAAAQVTALVELNYIAVGTHFFIS